MAKSAKVVVSGFINSDETGPLVGSTRWSMNGKEYLFSDDHCNLDKNGKLHQPSVKLMGVLSTGVEVGDLVEIVTTTADLKRQRGESTVFAVADGKVSVQREESLEELLSGDIPF